MSTRKRKPREKVVEARKVPIRAAPVVTPKAVKPSPEAKTVPVAVETTVPAPKVKAPVIEVKPALPAEVKAVSAAEMTAPVVETMSVPYAELSVPDAETKTPMAEERAVQDYFKTWIEGIEFRLRIIDEKVKPVDMKSVEDKLMFTISAIGETNKSLASIEEEIRMFTTVAKVVLGIGVVGLLGVLWGVLRMAGRI
jgi:hypothetical protein